MPMTRLGFGAGIGAFHAGNSPVSVLTNGSVTAVPSATTTTVATYTAVGTHTINRIGTSGDIYARWYIVINSVVKEEKVVSSARETDFEWNGGPLQLSNGDILDVKVRHGQTGATPDFAATVYGL